MPYQTILVRRLVSFIPDEAHAVAAELRAVAHEARELAERLRVINGDLESTWEGQARTRFLQDFTGLPPVMDSDAGWLEAEAATVAAIRVDRWEAVSENTWVPE